MTKALAAPLVRVGVTKYVASGTKPMLDLDPAAPDDWVPQALPWVRDQIRWGSQPLGVLFTGEETPAEHALVAAIERHYDKVHIAQNTVASRAALWALNFLRTLKRRPRWATQAGQPLIGRTAFVIGAGVSLEAVAHLLPELPRYGFTMACNSAARACTHFGLTPDMVLCAESIDLSGHLEGVGNRYAAIDATANPAAWAVRPDALAIGSCEHNFIPYLLRLGVVPLHFSTCVFNQAIGLAHAWGADRVVLLGQNLGFADGRCYAAGSPFADVTYRIDGQQVLFEGQSKQPLPQELVLRHDWDGNPTVHSAPTFDAEEFWLSHHCAPNIEVWNCSVGGARINGARHLPLEDALGKICDRLCGYPIADIEIPDAPDTASVLDDIAAQAHAFLGSPSHRIPEAFPLLHMWGAMASLNGLDGAHTRELLRMGAEQIVQAIRG